LWFIWANLERFVRIVYAVFLSIFMYKISSENIHNNLVCSFTLHNKYFKRILKIINNNTYNYNKWTYLTLYFLFSNQTISFLICLLFFFVLFIYLFFNEVEHNSYSRNWNNCTKIKILHKSGRGGGGWVIELNTLQNIFIMKECPIKIPIKLHVFLL